MADVNPLSHRYHLAELERSALACRRAAAHRSIARLLAAVRRLLAAAAASEAA